MRKGWKTAVALLTVASMGIGSIPITAQAVNATNVKSNREKRVQKSLDNTELYAEGEAIILYDTQSASVAKSAIASMDGDIEIVKSYDFEESNISAKSGSTQSSGGMIVSLVQSDTLSTTELVAKLSNRKDIKYAEPNYRIKATGTADYTKYQWGLNNSGQNGGTVGADVNADSISNDNEDGDTRVIALVDTGIDYTHEDLKDVVWNNPEESTKFKGAHGYDFINGDDDPLDDNGHGTHCSGIMAAANDSIGVSGVANSDNIKIMGLKILDAEGYGYGMEAVGAYNYIYKAQQMGINVVAVNNSWGGASESESYILQSLIDLVGENGAISVCAAGNSAEDNDTVSAIPANIDSSYVISVAASNENDELAAFSCYGATSVDIAAPGTDILSTVSYDCFNPGIYEDKDALCAQFTDFSSGTLVKTIDDDKYTDDADRELTAEEIAYGINTFGGGAEISLEFVEDSYFGEKEEGAKSLRWKLEGVKADEVYYLYFPYTVEADSENHSASITASVTGPFADENSFFPSALYVCDAPLTEEGAYAEKSEAFLSGTDITMENNYWSHCSGMIGKVKAGDKRALAVQVYAAADGDYTVHLDNLGISKAGVDASAFGKYDYYNGTSMATPHVTGAVAAVANAYPDSDSEPGEFAKSVKSRILGSTRKSEVLQGKVSTGGVLDLSLAKSPNMSLESVSMWEDGSVEMCGAYLGGATVKVNGSEVDIIEQGDDYIVFDGSDYVNKAVIIELSKNDDVITVERFFAQGEEFEYGYGMSGSLEKGSVASDGNKMYVVGQSGMVSTGVPCVVEDMKSMEWTSGSMSYTPDLFGDEYTYCVDGSLSNVTDVVYGNGKLWIVAKLDVGYSEETALLCYDSQWGWSKVASVASDLDDVEGYSIAYYNNDIYLLGGYDHGDGALSDKMYRYDSEEENWVAAPKLPEGRIYAKTLQTNGKLIVTLGGSDSDNEYSNLIFDGEDWSVSEKELEINANVSVHNFGGNDINVVDAQIGIVDDGVVYTNCCVDGLGDTFIYDVSMDTYEASGYMLDSANLNYDHIYATTLQNDLYVIFGFEEEIYYEDWMSAKSKALSEDYEGDVDWSNYIELLTMPVDTGFVEVVYEVQDGMKMLNAGYHIPGDTIPLLFEIDENYFIKNVKVDGEKIEEVDGEYFYHIPMSVNSDEITVQATLGAYVTEVVIPETQEIAPGESIELNPEIAPANADNQNLIWYSEDEDIVFVDEDGVVTAAEDAVVGTEVVIYVESEDREMPMAECTVIITEKSQENNTEDPDAPVDPNAPEDPNTPTDPDAPVDPNEPTDSNTPTNPDATTDPSVPTDKNTSTENTEESTVLPKVGTTTTIKKCKYKVLSNSSTSKTVAFVALKNKKAKSITVPATVKINNQTFKVTTISKDAFKNCKKLKKVTVGKNVTSIGKNAFKNCSKLSKITIKSTKITKVEKNKISKKVVIKVPKASKKKYKRMFKKAGYKGTIK